VPAWIKPHLAPKWADAYDVAYGQASLYDMGMLSTMFEKYINEFSPIGPNGCAGTGRR
jgi:hypothetical protein